MAKKKEQIAATCPACKSEDIRFAAGGKVTCGSCGKTLTATESDETDGELEEQDPDTAPRSTDTHRYAHS